MKATFAEATRAVTTRFIPCRAAAPAIQRCGGKACPPGTCDHDGQLNLQRQLGGASGHDQGNVAPSAVHATLAQGGQPLDPGVRAFMEPRFGHNFGQVRVHDNAQAAASAETVGARAYTVGSHIAFAAGAYAPGTEQGRRLIAHELAHTVQQGASEPRTVQRQGGEHPFFKCEALGVPCKPMHYFNHGPCLLKDCVPAATANLPFAISPGICIYQCPDGATCVCVLVGSKTSAVCAIKICTDPASPSSATDDPHSIGLALVDQVREQVLATGTGGAAPAEDTAAPAESTAPTTQAKLAVGEPGDAFEREADDAADRVMRMPAPDGGTGCGTGCCGGSGSGRALAQTSMLVARSPVVMRQSGGQGSAQPTADPIEAARAAAWGRTFRAYTRLARIGPPPPPGRERAAEIGERADQLALRNLATTLFQWNPPNMDQITEIVGAMRDRLGPGLRTVRAPANDPQCGNRDGYVVGFRQPVHLCPRFFRAGAEEQIETMVHEVAHLAGIGQPDPESYCGQYDCATSCGGFDSADSWGHFVHCASGQAPQQTVVQGGRPAPPQQSPPPQGRQQQGLPSPVQP